MGKAGLVSSTMHVRGGQKSLSQQMSRYAVRKCPHQIYVQGISWQTNLAEVLASFQPAWSNPQLVETGALKGSKMEFYNIGALINRKGLWGPETLCLSLSRVQLLASRDAPDFGFASDVITP